MENKSNIDIINADYDNLSNPKKTIWMHYRKKAIIAAQFTELLIAEINVLLNDYLQPLFLDCNLDRNTYRKSMTLLKYLARQMNSFEEKVDYNLADDLDVKKLNISNILSWAGQVRKYYFKFRRLMEEIALENEDLIDMISSFFTTTDGLAENISTFTYICKKDQNLFVQEDRDIKRCIEKYGLDYIRDKSFEDNCEYYHSNCYSNWNNVEKSEINLSKNIRTKVKQFMNNNLIDNSDKNQADKIIELCNKFMQVNIKVMVQLIIEYSDNLETIFLDCNLNKKIGQYYKKKSDMLKAIRYLDQIEEELHLYGHERYNKVLSNYIEFIEQIAKYNPTLKSFIGNFSHFLKSFHDQIYIIDETTKKIKLEHSIQEVAIEFISDYKIVKSLENIDKKSNNNDATIKLLKEDNSCVYLSDFIKELKTAFDCKWGEDAYYDCSPSIEGDFFEPDSPNSIFSNCDHTYKNLKYFGQCKYVKCEIKSHEIELYIKKAMELIGEKEPYKIVVDRVRENNHLLYVESRELEKTSENNLSIDESQGEEGILYDLCNVLQHRRRYSRNAIEEEFLNETNSKSMRTKSKKNKNMH